MKLKRLISELLAAIIAACVATGAIWVMIWLMALMPQQYRGPVFLTGGLSAIFFIILRSIDSDKDA